MIRRIFVKDFRSLASAEVEANWITSFVGSNDAGKSNVLRALNLFFNGHTDHDTPFEFSRDYNAFAVERQRKAKQIEIEVIIELPSGYQRQGYSKNVRWKKVWREEGEVPSLGSMRFEDGTDFPPRSKIPALLSRVGFTYIPAIKDQAFFGDLQGKLYDVLAAVAAKPLKASAGQFEKQLEEQLRELLDSIRAGLGTSSTMRLPENLREIFENLEISSDGIPLSRRGDGIKIRHIPMMLNFINIKRDNLLNKGGVRYTHIWGFEEPENNVEMSAAFEMAEELGNIIAENDNVQMLFTTHSPIFYRLDDLGEDYEDWVTTHFVAKKGHETKLSEKSPSEVDESMGLMPIVAPYVRKAKERFDVMQEALDEARTIIAQGTPTVFVEGETDKRIFKHAWRLFSGRDDSDVRFHDGGNDDYGSAEAVRSRTTAWLLENKHKPNPDRMRCFAVFDDDTAGEKAKSGLIRSIDDLNLKSIPHTVLKLSPTQEIGRMRGAGYLVPVDLEALYSDEIWEHAEKKGWLEDRPKLQKLVSEQLLEKALNEPDFQLGAGLNKNQLRRFKKQFSKKGKEKASKYICRLSKYQSVAALNALKPAVDKISNAL